jgi:nifR3 family TIM-barrel protein
MASPLYIGTLALDGRAFLAPMSGITDHGFRKIARRFGASVVVSEMVASDEFVKGDAEYALRAEGDGITPHIVQLAGCDPHWMGEAARLAEANGADVIDINMGCPAKRVTGGYAGSALMRDLDHALSLIEATVAAATIPVTVKMRLGWDDTSVNAPELAHRAEQAGVALVTVHGRTRCQFYKGSANHAAIAPVKAAVSIPVVCNGDVETIEQARAVQSLSGADAVMIGRAALGRPWLVGRIARGLEASDPGDPPRKVQAAAVIEHYESLLSALGERAGLRHARKHLAASLDHLIAEGTCVDAVERAAILTGETPRAIIATLAAIYARAPERLAA